MAGTDITKQLQDTALAPVIILVEPQLGENIGMCARAMLNCAVTELRIVNPRDGWPSEPAIKACSGADVVLNNVKLYTSTKDAIADLEFVLATTARERGMTKKVYSPEEAAKEIRRHNASGTQKCGILFGRERTGLENDEVAMSNAILNIPLNPGFSSLNLAQAVLLVCFSWLAADNPFEAPQNPDEIGHTALAKKEEIELLMTHMEDELSARGFFRSPEQRPTIMRNIRNFFFRSTPTEQDVRTLRGIISCLTGKKTAGRDQA
jgi:tRNA/rRNA methyltransferase